MHAHSGGGVVPDSVYCHAWLRFKRANRWRTLGRRVRDDRCDVRAGCDNLGVERKVAIAGGTVFSRKS